VKEWRVERARNAVELEMRLNQLQQQLSVEIFSILPSNDGVRVGLDYDIDGGKNLQSYEIVYRLELK
jgi:hypothetical protein